MSEFYNKEDLAAIDDREFAEVEVKWGKAKKLRLRSLDAAEMSDVSEHVYEQTAKQKKVNYNLCVLGQMICDGEGKPLYESIPEGEKAFQKFSPVVIRKLLIEARKLTPITEGDFLALEQVEDIAKNSETPPADSSID